MDELAYAICDADERPYVAGPVSNIVRTCTASASSANGLPNTCTLGASYPSSVLPAYPVMDMTGSPGLRSCSASAAYRPFDPLGRSTSVTSTSTRMPEHIFPPRIAAWDPFSSAPVGLCSGGQGRTVVP